MLKTRIFLAATVPGLFLALTTFAAVPARAAACPTTSDGSPLLTEYYRAMQASDDPCPGLDGFLSGRATVGPLQQFGAGDIGPSGPAVPTPGGCRYQTTHGIPVEKGGG